MQAPMLERPGIRPLIAFSEGKPYKEIGRLQTSMAERLCHLLMQ